MAEITALADEIRRAHRGDPWHGPAVARVLDGVTPQEAAAHPIPGAHSIWELALHLVAWRGEVARRVATGRFGEPPEGDWPVAAASADAPGGGETGWQSVRARLEAAEAALQAALRAFPPARLDEIVGGERDAPLGTGVTYRVMLHGVAQHDAYHAGQMSLLRRAYAASARGGA